MGSAKQQLKLDNARVNRADEKCKLVKMESDTMGAGDHPTTGQPESCGRFGSTHCYPTGGASLCWFFEFRCTSNTAAMTISGKTANKQNNIVFATPK